MTKRVLPSLAIMALLAFAALGQESNPQSSRVMPPKYDPARDANKDIRDAVGEAKRTGKRVLLDVGGEWCVWCHRMDSFIEQNLDLAKLLEKHYIVVKINVDPKNRNEAVLSHYPAIPGYPHLFVLDMNGELVHSQDTSALEAGKSYDLNRFMSFLKKWAPSR
ncbi:MAG TPA: thioredoxin family protein [Blastocatellia bacterium]|jgi:thioredoxin-related protein|nr:thioredoxin family protein [Blastocatellia bacterium]